MKSSIKRDKVQYSQSYTCQFKNMTKGEVMAMFNAFKVYAQESAVGHDLYMYLKNAIYEAKEPTLQDVEEYSIDLNTRTE